MEIKQFDCNIALTDREEGLFAGYASVFDVVDNHKDAILYGAFTETLKKKHNGKDIKLLWQHKMDEPIGVFTTMREDSHGLYVEGKLLLDVQRGKEAYSLLKSGAMDGLSIGYSAVKYGYDEETGVRFLTEVELWEVSLVTFPANEAAGVTALKDDKPQTIREFEVFLREGGFSRKEAKAIASQGWMEKEKDCLQAEELKLLQAIEVAIALALCH